MIWQLFLLANRIWSGAPLLAATVISSRIWSGIPAVICVAHHARQVSVIISRQFVSISLANHGTIAYICTVYTIMEYINHIVWYSLYQFHQRTATCSRNFLWPLMERIVALSCAIQQENNTDHPKFKGQFGRAPPDSDSLWELILWEKWFCLLKMILFNSLAQALKIRI